MICRYVNKPADNLTPLLFDLKRNQWGGEEVTEWTGQVDFDQKVNLLTQVLISRIAPLSVLFVRRTQC